MELAARDRAGWRQVVCEQQGLSRVSQVARIVHMYCQHCKETKNIQKVGGQL